MTKKYTAGLLDIFRKLCYNEHIDGNNPANQILTNERVKTMNAIMNNAELTAGRLYSERYQHMSFFRYGESAVVLRTEHTGFCSAALTWRA